MEPIISVIIPVFNGEKYLAEAIESVLSQDGFDFDIIVVDDGSTDNTAKIAENYKSSLRYHYQINSGAGAARNHGVSMARGDFFAFLDADDLWTSGKMQLQWQVFQEYPDLDMVLGHVQQFYSPDLTQSEKERIDIPAEIMPGYHLGAMLIRKQSFLQVGLFREELRIGDTIDWYARSAELKLKSIMLPDILMKRRIHKTNLGISQRDQRKGYIHALKSALDRRRNN